MKKIITIFVGIFIAGFGWLITQKPTPPFGAVIPVDQRLKAPKQDILMAQEFTHFKKNKDKDKISGTETQAIKYAYKSNKQILDNDLEPNSPVQAHLAKQNLQLGQEVVKKRTSHYRYFKTSDPKVDVLEIIDGEPQYYKDPQGNWWQALYATTSLDFYNQQTADSGWEKFLAYFMHSVYASCAGTPVSPCTSFPDANPETNTVDGHVGRSGVDQTISAISTGAGTEANDVATDDYLVRLRSSTTSNQFSTSLYSIFGFDTSGIGAGSTVTAATISISGNTDPGGDPFGTSGLIVFTKSSAPATATALVTGDYDKPTTTAITTGRLMSAWDGTDNVYNVFTINDLTAISQTGVTWISAMSEAQRARSIASNFGTWVESDAFAVTVYFSDKGSSQPKLVVTFSAGGTEDEVITNEE